jgi:hypothetical protein
VRLDGLLRSAVGLLATAVAVVAGALWLLPIGGAEPGSPTGSQQVVAPDVVEDAGLAAQVAAAGEVESYEVFGGKNPFQRPPEGGAVPTTTTTTPGTGGGTTTTTTFFPPGGGGGTSTTTTVVPGQDPIRGTTIALVDVFAEGSEKKAVVRVNGRLYVAAEGDTFAGDITLVRVDLGTRCADFTMGSRPFSLCVGQEIIK